jgi:hypothetical protein
MTKRISQPGNTSGSLTLSLLVNENVVIDIPGMEPVILFLARVDTENRVSVNIRAPREYNIRRVGTLEVHDRRGG